MEAHRIAKPRHFKQVSPKWAYLVGVSIGMEMLTMELEVFDY